MSDSLDSKYFDDVYAANKDPWNFETSEYEREKYAHTLASLPQAQYRIAFEVGCSIGVLTAQLALRCHSLLSVDLSQAALQQARERCRHLPQVALRQMTVPKEFPEGKFDLIVVSEVAYYLSQPDLELLADKIAHHQDPESDLILVHFTPTVPDYPATGDRVHDYFLGRSEWKHWKGSREENYRIDVLRKASS